MHYQISCPSCSMNASTSDHRHFSPAGTSDGAELRRCRNCGDVVALGHDPMAADLQLAYEPVA